MERSVDQYLGNLTDLENSFSCPLEVTLTIESFVLTSRTLNEVITGFFCSKRTHMGAVVCDDKPSIHVRFTCLYLHEVQFYQLSGAVESSCVIRIMQLI